MNCPNCGRELADGEVCNCMENNPFNNTQPINEPEINEMPNEEYAAQPPYQQPYQQPYQEQQNVYYAPNFNATNGQYGAPQYYSAPPVQAMPARTDYPQGYKIKRKYAAVLLGATLGLFGIHNFYLGNSSKAIAQLLLSTVGCFALFLGPIAAGIWALVETVQLLTDSIDRDANGFKIQTFEEAIVKAQLDAQNKEQF